MSADNRVFLHSGGFIDTEGSSATLGLTFTSEKDLDELLWFNPEEAPQSVRYLLKAHGGEMTPTLSRLALKAVALPLFEREFQGEEVTETVSRKVNNVAFHNSILLDAYLDRVGDESIDQSVLDQAITDSVILQLVSRSLRSKTLDDIIALPIGPDRYDQLATTNFTVLRRKSLGRAHLVATDAPSTVYRQDPNVNQHRIVVSPTKLTGSDHSMHDLAEALISEQQIDEEITGDEYDLINTSAARLYTQIHAHFDAIQPRS